MLSSKYPLVVKGQKLHVYTHVCTCAFTCIQIGLLLKLCMCVHVDLCRRRRRNLATLELLPRQTDLEVKSRFSKILRKYVPWLDCAWFLPMHAVFYLVVTIIFRLIQCTYLLYLNPLNMSAYLLTHPRVYKQCATHSIQWNLSVVMDTIRTTRSVLITEVCLISEVDFFLHFSM